MHPNPAFRTASRVENIRFARQRSFGVLTVNGDAGPLLSHIPFRLSEDGSWLEAHIVRSNPIARLLDQPAEAVMAVSGGDAYVSPDWYGVEQQVPTWNYVAVHLRGTLRRLEDDALNGILQRLSDGMEARLAPKTPWTLDKLDPDIYAKLTRQILPIGMEVRGIEGTWKLSQNKSAEARAGAASGLAGVAIGSAVNEIIALMRSVPED